jgi:hypothetical protein
VSPLPTLTLLPLRKEDSDKASREVTLNHNL